MKKATLFSLLPALAGLAAPTAAEPWPAEPAGLVIRDLRIGDGAQARGGEIAVVHYTGWLYDPAAEEGKGAQFDSSRDRGEPFAFPLGAGRVIRGWDQGVVGMQVGGRRLLLIPPDLAYGARGAGGVIPPNATLLFDVELLRLDSQSGSPE